MADLKRDPERLHQAATLLEAENKKLLDKVIALQARIDALEGRDPGTLQMQIAELEQQLSVRNQAPTTSPRLTSWDCWPDGDPRAVEAGTFSAASSLAPRSLPTPRSSQPPSGPRTVARLRWTHPRVD